MLIALAAVGLLLVIACTNAAGLLVARGLRQRPEIAVRAALGASRRRIVAEFLAESAILACLGAAVGLGLAALGVRLATTVRAGFIPRIHEIGLDGRVLGFFAVTTLGSLALLGLVPALEGTMYLNARQFPPNALFFVVRTAVGDPLSVLPAFRSLVREIEPGAPISEVASGRELVRETLQEPRYLSFLVGGVVAGFALTRTLSSVLFGVGAADPLVFAAVALGLLGLAALAGYSPARQAAGIDPANLLQEE